MTRYVALPLALFGFAAVGLAGVSGVIFIVSAARSVFPALFGS